MKDDEQSFAPRRTPTDSGRSEKKNGLKTAFPERRGIRVRGRHAEREDAGKDRFFRNNGTGTIARRYPYRFRLRGCVRNINYM
jgi:hypothetical protein